MIYQLPNGRIIEMSVEQFLELNDQDIQELVGLSPIYSMEVSNPFYKLNCGRSTKKEKRDPELDHEIEPDLTDINPQDKIDDTLFHRDDI